MFYGYAVLTCGLAQPPLQRPGNYVRYSERLAAELAKTHDGGVIWANQFDNTANMQGH